MHKATLFKKTKEKKIQCLACSHYCKIPTEQTGICGIRENKDGELYLLVYGKAIAANIDPIEKKPLYHFMPGTKIFSIGTIGCNFQCSFCQNWDISQMSRTIKRRLKAESKEKDFEAQVTKMGYDLPPEKIIEYCQKKDIPSIAYTYNEPSIFFEYTFDTAKLAYEKGMKNVYVSNGYASHEAIDKIAPYLDAINVDLKSFSEEFYQKICKASLKPVLDNIEYYHKKGIWMEITTLLIPEENDSEEEIKQCAEFIASISKSIPWHISRFHPAYKMKDKASTSPKVLNKAYEIGKEAGLKYVYVGNIHDEKHQNTYCPECDELIIKRNWGYSKIINMENNQCGECGYKVEGAWNM
ncbi:AmmeMemoRadiSam system radical SAM enzyme [Candidatus Dojkabacteria bacterium]|nr:AmmeMemoRadiSam system radical SAM enzyme [Candidatus Dojkabacteria bacterium]